MNNRLWTCLCSMEPRVDISEAELSGFEDLERPIDACVAQSQGLSGPDLVVLSYHSDSDDDRDDIDYEPSSRVHEFMSS